MKKYFLLATVIIIVIAIILINPFKTSEVTQASPTQNTTAVVQRGELIIAINSTGVIEPVQTVELKSKASGEIVDFPLDEGDPVKKGQIIAKLDPVDVQNEYNQAVADLEVAKVALSQAAKQADRQKQLFDDGLISELDYENSLLAKEQANSTLIKTQTTLDNAKERLQDTQLESPINGIILQKNVEEGQIIASGISAVSGGTAIASVADMSEVLVRASVDEVDIGQVQAGQKATVIAESYPDREFQGVVARVHPQAKVEQNVTTFDVTIDVDNSEGLLMAGMNASVEIIAGYQENILLVPREALTDARAIARMIGAGPIPQGGAPNAGMQQANRGGGRGNDENRNKADHPSKMVIVIKDGKQEPREVEIGISNFERAQVLSGLAEGDTVLTTVTSKALADRQDMLERMRSWNRLPGMGGR